MAKLTELGVERLRADPGKRVEVPDGSVPGLYLVVQPSGAKSWAARGRLHGKPVKVTLGRWPVLNLGVARKRAGEVFEQLDRGEDPREARATALAAAEQRRQETVGALLDEYEKRHLSQRKPTTAREAMRLLRRELAEWQCRSIHSITRRDVLKVLDAAVDRGSTTLANRALAHVRALFNWTIQRGVLSPTGNPCAGLKPPSPEKSRDRVLADDELVAVWRVAGRMAYPFGPAFRLLIATAQRREEVGQLEWGEIDLDARLWTMPAVRNKGGRQHVLPLNDLAVDALRECPKAGSYVFTTTGRSAVSGWSKAKAILDRQVAQDRRDAAEPERAGKELTDDELARHALPSWVIHDLRRSTASRLVPLGTRPDIVEAVLGHAHPGGSPLASVYQRHSYLPEMKAALDAWDRALRALLDPAPAKVVRLRPRS